MEKEKELQTTEKTEEKDERALTKKDLEKVSGGRPPAHHEKSHVSSDEVKL